MTVQGSLWITVVRLVYIAVFGAIVAVLTRATNTLFKPWDIKQFRTFEG
jgi:cobalamin biosynthesis protein CobD/CbiB